MRSGGSGLYTSREASACWYGGATDAGPRPLNQDCYGYASSGAGPHSGQSGTSIFVLADGMGGYEGGEVAARTAVEQTIAGFQSSPSGASLADRLRAAIRHANSRVMSAAADTPGAEKMGSTVVACAIKNGSMSIAHVGDSRAYLVRGGVMQQLTQDHRHRANILSRVLGRESGVPDLIDLASLPGDRLLLCSDGVYGALSPEELQRLMESAETAQEASSSIIRAARVNAGDNISALAVFVPGGQTSEPPAWRFPAMIAALFGALALVVVMLMATSFNSATEQTSPNMPMNIKVFDEPGCDVTILAKETGMQCAGKSAGDTVTLTRKKKEAHFLADREVWGVLYEYDGKRCYAPVIAGEIVWKCVIRKSDPQLVVYHF